MLLFQRVWFSTRVHEPRVVVSGLSVKLSLSFSFYSGRVELTEVWSLQKLFKFVWIIYSVPVFKFMPEQICCAQLDAASIHIGTVPGAAWRPSTGKFLKFIPAHHGIQMHFLE